MSENEIEEHLSQWEDQLRKAGKRLTTPRRVILKAALQFEEPFTAEGLLAKAREADRLISLATIYRTLSVLEDGGAVRRVEAEGDKQRYESGSPQNTRVYVICSDCGQTFSLQDDCLDVRQRFLTKQMGFEAQEITLRVKANCQILQNKGTCERQKNTALSEEGA